MSFSKYISFDNSLNIIYGSLFPISRVFPASPLGGHKKFFVRVPFSTCSPEFSHYVTGNYVEGFKKNI